MMHRLVPANASAHKALTPRKLAPWTRFSNTHRRNTARNSEHHMKNDTTVCSSQDNSRPVAELSPLNFVIPLGIAVPLATLKLVPVHNIAFAAAWPVYLALVNYLRFNNNTSFREVTRGGLVPWPWVKPYASFAAVLSIIIPLVLICLPGQAPAVRHMLAPHLFLLSAQVSLEYVSFTLSWAILARMLVPIGFNTFRLLALSDWLQQAHSFGLGHTALAWVCAAFWVYNLFGFLLLKMLPLYLDPARSPP